MALDTLPLPPLLAGGGEFTVMRPLAAATWGAYDETWPEGVEPSVNAGEGRKFGYVSALPAARARRVGRLGRRFVRADLSISAADGTSNVEEKLDEAADRTSGQAFFDRDIPPEGLGRLVPNVHFRKGDIVPVRLWVWVLPAPVTQVEWRSDGEELAGYHVHVGGQLVSDEDAFIAANDETRRTILQERREAAAAVDRVTRRTDTMNRDLTGSRYGSIWDAVNGGVDFGALGTLNYRVDEVSDEVNAITRQGGLLDDVRDDVQSIDNVVNGSSPPTTNGNLWRTQNNINKAHQNFMEIQSQINGWVTDAITVLDNRIPNTLSLSRNASISGVGRIYRSGDSVKFRKWFTASCRVLFVVALEAIDSYAMTEVWTMTGGMNQEVTLHPGILQNITSASVTVFRMDEMPTMDLDLSSLL